MQVRKTKDPRGSKTITNKYLECVAFVVKTWVITNSAVCLSKRTRCVLVSGFVDVSVALGAAMQNTIVATCRILCFFIVTSYTAFHWFPRILSERFDKLIADNVRTPGSSLQHAHLMYKILSVCHLHYI